MIKLKLDYYISNYLSHSKLVTINSYSNIEYTYNKLTTNKDIAEISTYAFFRIATNSTNNMVTL